MARNASIRMLYRLGWRAWWLLLILVHLPALSGVGRSALNPTSDGPGLVMGLAIILSVLFFLLKLLDVRFLRIGSRRCEVVAFILAFALVHHHFAASAVGSAAMQQAPAALATALAAAALSQGRRALRSIRSLAITLRQRLVPNPLWCTTIQRERSPQSLTAIQLCAARAPPPCR